MDIMKFIEDISKILKKELKILPPPFSFTKAKVSRSYQSAGKAYADVVILKPDGSDDENFPVLPELELPCSPTKLPDQGSQLRVGFYYFDASQPFVDALL